jgi:hypothetical protein
MLCGGGDVNKLAIVANQDPMLVIITCVFLTIFILQFSFILYKFYRLRVLTKNGNKISATVTNKSVDDYDPESPPKYIVSYSFLGQEKASNVYDKQYYEQLKIGKGIAVLYNSNNHSEVYPEFAVNRYKNHYIMGLCFYGLPIIGIIYFTLEYLNGIKCCS